MAKHALVFMLTAINCRFKLPIAYFFTCGTSANEKAKFISALLLNLNDKNIDVRCLTFDGPAVSRIPSKLDVISLLVLIICKFNRKMLL